jgi:signal transduction histidine kinase/DNA-binding response OmpR family regulator
MRTEDLLKQSQSLAQELQSRQEELQQTNQELQEKARLLAHQNVEVERKNSEVEQARQALEEKAEQLALTSKYKSEFLANMSHELRTPLNSLLILSDQLSKNPYGNLSEKQTEYAKTIHSSGNDLLMLINDILDLSKIESGTVVVDVGELRIADLHNYVERTFRHVAEAKGVEFIIESDPNLPRVVTTDSKRLQQIIKNLLSNAFKFTHRGNVRFTVERARTGWDPENETLSTSESVIAITVADTGIGIPAEKQQIIFEAFQQADGSTSRKYGGTGLGLAISREIARLLGGEISLSSEPSVGSTFTLYLPQSFTPQAIVRRSAVARAKPAQRKVEPPKAITASVGDTDGAIEAENECNDDRSNTQIGDRTLLIVDNDLGFAQFALETARKLGFKGIVTPLGASAIALAGDFEPKAILLDISLPDIEGWQILQRIKRDVSLQHIPVFIVSTTDQPERGIKLGAHGVLAKPIQTAEVLEEFLTNVRQYVDRNKRKIVLVDGADQLERELSHTFANTTIEIVRAGSAEQALETLDGELADAVVLTPNAQGCSIASLAEQLLMQEAGCRRLYLHAPQTKSEEDGKRWVQIAREFGLELTDSLPQLANGLAQTTCLSLECLPDPTRNMLADWAGGTMNLAGKKVLIVDDDIRNIFALTSVLERHDIVTDSAETGRDAIEMLQASPDFDIVLMDIMMPEMDGIDTMKAIRRIAHLEKLPIIAVTAKAMKGDREKCIDAGAWDYLSKPVDPEQLLTVLRAWLAV